MDEDNENDNCIQSPFGRFMQKQHDEELDSFSSLGDLIKAHAPKSNSFLKCETANPNLLSTLTCHGNSSSNLFNNDSETCHNLSSFINKSLKSDDFCKEKSSPKNTSGIDGEDFNTLEEYTKSFLHSRGTFSIPSGRFQFQKSESSSTSPSINSDLTLVDKKLSQVRISHSNNKPIVSSIKTSDISNNLDNWNIDLSLALQDTKFKKVETATSSKLNEYVYSAHAKECNLDVSNLANETLLYSSSVFSSFGYVLCKKWRKLPLSRKCRKIGLNWPYKISKSFKFDSPSPDDILMKNKAKARTTSLNEA